MPRHTIETLQVEIARLQMEVNQAQVEAASSLSRWLRLLSELENRQRQLEKMNEFTVKTDGG